MTITGTNLNGATSVKFGTTPAATFRITGTTKIVAKTKAHAAGTVKISVTTLGGATTSTANFKFVVRPDHHLLHTDQRLDARWDDGDHHRDQLQRGHVGQVRHNTGHNLQRHRDHQDRRQDQGARGRHSQDLGHHPRRDGHLDATSPSSSPPRPSPRSHRPAARRSVGRR